MSAELIHIPVPGTDREIMATQIDGEAMVSLRHACDTIGIALQAQLSKLKGKSWAGVTMIVTPSAGGDQQTAMIDRRTFTMWLATIDTRRVSLEARPIIEAFQTEAADALDAYFNEGGAVNPRATEDQLDRIAREAQSQAAVLRALKGVVDPKHLEAKGRLILARAMGEKPELDRTAIPLYVWDFLTSKGLKKDMAAAKAAGFGKRIKACYIKEYNREPQRAHQELPNGQIREVYAYTEADRPLFESVWARDYAGVVADSALKVLPGGAS
jgi:hypothetical protein